MVFCYFARKISQKAMPLARKIAIASSGFVLKSTLAVADKTKIAKIIAIVLIGFYGVSTKNCMQGN